MSLIKHFIRNVMLGVMSAPGGVLDRKTQAALTKAGLRLRRNQIGRAVIGQIGDSIPQAQVLSWPLANADAGVWFSSTVTPSQPTFLFAAVYASRCASNETGTIEWDGVSLMRTAIAGDTPGPWVDINGGGFFELVSGTNGKSMFIIIRWRNRGVATTFTVTNTGNTYPPGRFGLAGIFSGGLMRSGVMSQKILNYSIGGDQAIDVYNRIDQMLDRGIDLAMISVGVNLISDAATYVPLIVAKCTARGVPVLVNTTPPRAWATAQDVAYHDAAVAAIKATSGPGVMVVACDPPLRNPANAVGSIEIKPMYNDDEIHLAYNATLCRMADRYDPILRQMFPWASKVRPVTLDNVYNATTNPYGNLIGARALMTGTAGAKGTSPVPTGELPDSWADVTVGGAFTSILLFCPGSATPRPCADDPTQYWSGAVYTNAVGVSTRYLQVPCEFVPTVGKKYRVRAFWQMKAVSKLTEFEIDVVFTGATSPTRMRTCQMGTLPNTTTNTLDDTGVMMFESDDFEVPAGTTAAIVRFVVGCQTGGGLELRASRADLFPIET